MKSLITCKRVSNNTILKGSRMAHKSERPPWQLWSTRRIYAPLVPRILWLIVRHRVTPQHLFRINPRLRFAGTGLDSKLDRYRLFSDCDYAIPTLRISDAMGLTYGALDKMLANHRISYPVIVKPDCGLFSVGVRLIANTADLLAFLRKQQVDYLLQQYEAGREFALYYYRDIGASSGRILDLTERILPFVVGDGISSIEELIDRRSEWKFIAHSVKNVYIDDLRAVPKAGDRIRLAIAAGGGVGALFRDSRDLITEELCQAIDRIAVPREFYLGKFDFKVDSISDLQRGENFKMLEVNGPLAELNWIWDRRYDYRTAVRAISAHAELVVRLASSARTNTRQRIPLRVILQRIQYQRARVAAVRSAASAGS